MRALSVRLPRRVSFSYPDAAVDSLFQFHREDCIGACRVLSEQVLALAPADPRGRVLLCALKANRFVVRAITEVCPAHARIA